jgi:hypothetical protein
LTSKNFSREYIHNTFNHEEVKVKVKGKVHLLTGHESPEE